MNLYLWYLLNFAPKLASKRLYIHPSSGLGHSCKHCKWFSPKFTIHLSTDPNREEKYYFCQIAENIFCIILLVKSFQSLLPVSVLTYHPLIFKLLKQKNLIKLYTSEKCQWHRKVKTLKTKKCENSTLYINWHWSYLEFKIQSYSFSHYHNWKYNKNNIIGRWNFSCKSDSRIANIRPSVWYQNPSASQNRSYRLLSLSTIEPIDHQAYQPSSLSAIGLSAIVPLDHHAYLPLSLSCISENDEIPCTFRWKSCRYQTLLFSFLVSLSHK